MNTYQNCPICDAPAAILDGRPVRKVDCPRCGQFEQVIPWLRPIDTRQRVALSGWVREQNAAGSTPQIDEAIIQRTASMQMPGYRERSRKLLKVIVEKTGNIGGFLNQAQFANDLRCCGITYSADAAQVADLVRILEHEGSLEPHETSRGFFRLAAPGLLEVERMMANSSNSQKSFVAMSFEAEMRDAWTNGFDPAIRAAGYSPVRIDNKEYVGGITDEIIAEIREAKFIVADYTGQRSGVYFEAGFALGLGLVVIPTCRKDEIKNLHFDIRHLNTLEWEGPNDLRGNLAKRIRAVVGAGPNLV